MTRFAAIGSPGAGDTWGVPGPTSLAQRSELPGVARSEWRRRRLRWTLDAAGRARRRRLPAVAVIEGRLCVQVGGRVAQWGRTR